MANKEILAWLNDNLSDILSFPVPPDLGEYIITIENNRDIEDYMKTLLDLNNSKHKAFLEKYKAIRYTGESKEKNEKEMKSNGKKKQKPADPTKGDANVSDKSAEPESKGGVKPKKKNKFVNLYSSEGESKNVIFLKGRHMCECQASKHRLINNCLKCGRVVCAQEGSGPCLFCCTLVCSVEEQNILNANNKRSKKLYETLMSSAESEDLEKALEQRNRLLEYDRTTQQRSKVIDDESDYYSSTSTWLTKEERDRLQKKEEEAHARKHASRLERKFTLDFAGRRILEEVEDEVENENFLLEAYDKIKETLTENHAHPDFQTSIQPTFVSERDSQEYPASDSNSLSKKNIHFKVQDKELLLISDNGACLSMHQPWASFLVSGIKKHEGRSWYTSFRGRLWIAAASKVPTEDNIKDCEAFYRAFTGDENLEFPKLYPTSCLLGCVSLIDCLPQEEYRAKYPDGESESPFVFICEEPQELDVRFPMSGSHKIYKLDSRIHQAAKKALLRMAKQAKSES